MGNRQGNLLLWGALFVVSGIVLLLFNLGWLTRYEPWAQYIVAALLGLGGVGILFSYLWERGAWWRLMPGWTLLALGGMVWLSTYENVARQWVAALLFLGLALAFVNIYLVNRAEHWWAIIPGGFMAVLALVIGISAEVSSLATLGSLLFVGMGLVFGVVFLLAGRRRHWWALIPGTVLVFFGLMTYAVDNAVQGALLRWWPAALIVLGAIVAFASTLASPRPEKLPVNVAPRVAPRSPVVNDPGVALPPSELEGQRGQLGEYSEPAPGASVELLPDPDDRA